jgi:hypothetical protein
LLAKPTPRNINFGSDRFAMFNKQAGHPAFCHCHDMQDMRSFFGRGIWDTIFLALFDSGRMELPKELKGELLTNDFALVNVDDSYGRRYRRKK